ncbi:hypothetical protein ABT276_30920 [Streptomyces xantholiticus]|uniref:Uncharacterized protein n=1 Tax=Streptomyces xantholiticus TaxID=68285 RepID=A0ABV1V3Q5_9ACTN
MASKGPESSRTSHDPQHPYKCPGCGQPVAAIVKRHKTLGAYVPLWAPGPCRNPDCSLHVSTDHVSAEAAADSPENPDDTTGREVGTS